MRLDGENVIRRAEMTDLSTIAAVARATWEVAHAGIIPDEGQRRLLDRLYGAARAHPGRGKRPILGNAPLISQSIP